MEKKKSNKLKENPIMVDQKKVKNIKIDNSEDTNEIKSFIIIVVVIAVVIGVIYGLTEIFKKDELPKDEVVAGTIDYDKVAVGTILNRPYDKYYVIVYNSDDEKAVLYSTILTKYMQDSKEKDYVKIYYCDLKNKLNNDYYNKNNDGKSNPKAQFVEEFNFGDLTLLKIEKGKITKYIEDLDSIKEILK